jgi:ATP-dependent HslUV protease ATP-binding subunit HslU
MATEGVTVEFTDEAIDAIAQIAFDANRRMQNIGARRLYTILERVTEELSFHAPDVGHAQHVRITAEYVRQRLADVVKDEDLSRYIL